jgi:hypothetical protein
MQLKTVNFKCQSCGKGFQTVATTTKTNPDKPWHPYDYFTQCKCGGEARQVAWEQNLLKAHANATGPVTKVGKAIASQNAAGHSCENTRFNALQHGLYAKTAQYYPARPGKYPTCENCEFKNKECSDENHLVACLKKTELFMQTHIAFETGDHKILKKMHANTHAALNAILNDMILSVAQTGVEIKNPRWYPNPKTGMPEFVEYRDENGSKHQLHDIQAHPLLNKIIDLVQKNSLTLDDMNMTDKSQDDSELKGFITESGGVSMANVIEQRKLNQQKLLQVIEGETTNDT